MFGYTLLKAAMYCLPTPISGVHPHQLILPEVAEPLAAVVPELHPTSASTSELATPSAKTRDLRRLAAEDWNIIVTPFVPVTPC